MSSVSHAYPLPGIAEPSWTASQGQWSSQGSKILAFAGHGMFNSNITQRAKLNGNMETGYSALAGNQEDRLSLTFRAAEYHLKNHSLKLNLFLLN